MRKPISAADALDQLRQERRTRANVTIALVHYAANVLPENFNNVTTGSKAVVKQQAIADLETLERAIAKAREAIAAL